MVTIEFLKTVKLTEATASLAEYTRDLNNRPLVVTVRGKPIAALIPVEGVDLETLSVGTSPQFLDLIERSRRRHETEGGIPIEEIHREYGVPLPADRRSKRKARKPTQNKRAKKDAGQV